eukprot:2727507-Rhodomonas_salina.2
MLRFKSSYTSMQHHHHHHHHHHGVMIVARRTCASAFLSERSHRKSLREDAIGARGRRAEAGVEEEDGRRGEEKEPGDCAGFCGERDGTKSLGS